MGILRENDKIRIVFCAALIVLPFPMAAQKENQREELFPCRAAITMNIEDLNLAVERSKVLGLHRTPVEQGGWTLFQVVMSYSGELDGWAVTIKERLGAQGSGTFVVDYSSRDNKGDRTVSRSRALSEAQQVARLAAFLGEHFSKVRYHSPPLILDPDIYWFALYLQGQEPLCIETWSPDPGGDAASLVSFSKALRDFACGEIVEHELWTLADRMIVKLARAADKG